MQLSEGVLGECVSSSVINRCVTMDFGKFSTLLSASVHHRETEGIVAPWRKFLLEAFSLVG